MKSSSTIENPIRWNRATARRRASLAAFIVLAALFQPISSHANLITNGNFETPLPSFGFGWTFTNIDGAGGWRSTGGNPAGNFILNDGGSALTDPTISQNVTGLIVNAMYRLQGDVACGNICGGPEVSFGALLDGTAIFQRTTPSSASVYEPFSVDFMATSSTHAISFAGERNGSDKDPRIDNITLDLAPSQAVPEPGSLMLLLSGLAGVTGVAWRRRRRA